LPELYRRSFVLRRIDNLSTNEIGKKIDRRGKLGLRGRPRMFREIRSRTGPISVAAIP
jgi:hypothetical protein